MPRLVSAARCMIPMGSCGGYPIVTDQSARMPEFLYPLAKAIIAPCPPRKLTSRRMLRCTACFRALASVVDGVALQNWRLVSCAGLQPQDGGTRLRVRKHRDLG